MRLLSTFLLMLILVFPVGLHAETPSGSEGGDSSESFGQSLTAFKTYEELRRAISEVQTQSRVRTQKAGGQERVREAWEIGGLIDAHVLQLKERADYGQQVLLRLGKDLGMSDDELGYMLRFAKAYPICPRTDKLSWPDYRELLSVKDDEVRKALAERMENEGWSRARLRDEVKALKKAYGEGEQPMELLAVPYSGNPGTYKLVSPSKGPYAGELAIDLGFSNYFRLSEVVVDSAPFTEGEVIVFMAETGEVRSLGGQVMSAESPLFTYKAWVHRVLDGDTLEAVIDLGFGFITKQTLRLRGIDAPEIKAQGGVEAKELVESVLANHFQDGTPVLIKTSKSEKPDRYLADVFITDKSGEEKYLNNLLLEKGLAVRVSE